VRTGDGALDIRGHGASGGGSAVGGDPEVRDVDAAVHSARAAGPAATVWVVPGMGHTENGMTAPLVERIGRWALDAVGGDTTSPANSAVRDSSGTIRA
jgi:hypothetical protein